MVYNYLFSIIVVAVLILDMCFNNFIVDMIIMCVCLYKQCAASHRLDLFSPETTVLILIEMIISAAHKNVGCWWLFSTCNLGTRS